MSQETHSFNHNNIQNKLRPLPVIMERKMASKSQIKQIQISCFPISRTLFSLESRQKQLHGCLLGAEFQAMALNRLLPKYSKISKLLQGHDSAIYHLPNKTRLSKVSAQNCQKNSASKL